MNKNYKYYLASYKGDRDDDIPRYSKTIVAKTKKEAVRMARKYHDKDVFILVSVEEF